MWNDLWTLRDKTALFLVPPEKYREQAEIAGRLPSATVVDWREVVLGDVKPSQRFLNTSVDTELARIRKIADSGGETICLVNTEYFLARFSPEERGRFWRGLWGSFPHTASAVVLFVLNSAEIVPDKLDLAAWEQQGRLFDYEIVFREAANAQN